jgi:histidyl-tRNA synthetase
VSVVYAYEITQGLDVPTADRIGTYVVIKGEAQDVYQRLQSDVGLSSVPKAKEAIANMGLLIDALDILGVLPCISFDLSLARGLDYYTGMGGEDKMHCYSPY